MLNNYNINIAKYVIHFFIVNLMIFALLEIFRMIVLIDSLIIAIFFSAFISLFIVNNGKEYSLFVVVLTLFFAILLAIFHNVGIYLGALTGAVVITVSKFIRENNRIPTKSEKTKLVWFSMIVVWGVIFVIFIILALMFAGENGISRSITMILNKDGFEVMWKTAFVFFSSYFILSYGYEGLAKRIHKNTENLINKMKAIKNIE